MFGGSSSSIKTAIFTISITLALCCLSLRSVGAWEVKELSEMKCPKTPPTTTADLDYEWVQSVDLWYYAYASKLDLYRASAEAVNVSVPELRDADVYYNACVTFRWGIDPEPKFNSMGKSRRLALTPNPDGSLDFWFPNLKINCYATIPLTDNKSYIFFYGCWSDNTTSWGVISTKPVLEDDVVKEIHAYAKSIGFQERHFTYIRFDDCEPPEEEPEPEIEIEYDLGEDGYRDEL